jgi:hypothetical protein
VRANILRAATRGSKTRAELERVGAYDAEELICEDLDRRDPDSTDHLYAGCGG